MVKKQSFAAEMEDLLNSRAPKEALGEDEAVPALLDDDAWGEQVAKLDAEAAGQPRTKRLRMKGALSSAFTEGNYKGKVVQGSAAFDPFADADGEEEDMEEEEEEDEEDEEMSEDEDDDDVLAEARALMEAELGGGAAEVDEEEDEDEEMEEMEEEFEEEEEDEDEAVLAEARAMFENINLHDGFVPKKQAPADGKLAGDIGLDYSQKPPPMEGEDENDDEEDAKSNDSFVVDRKTGKVNEAAVSSKMDDIFGALNFDGSEDDEKGETYEQFVTRLEGKKKTKRRKAMKRKREDFDSDGSDADASEQEADADIAEQIAAIREAQVSTSKDIVKTMANEADRAAAVRNQYKIWGKLVGARIHMHPLVASAARLPSAYAYNDFAGEEGVPSGLEDVKQQLADVLNSLHSLREGLLEANPTLLSKPHLPTPKVHDAAQKGQAYTAKDLPNYYRLCVASASQVAAKADEVLDQWYSRAQLQGASATETTSIKRAQTSASAQVRETLQREHARLVHRTQKNRTGKLPLGHPMATEALENPRILQLPENLTNGELFDDSDFYSFLLQDYIQNCAEGTMTTTEDLEKIRRSARDPSRLLVDKRRSKQRKLSHEPIPKLVGFMAPVPQEVPAVIDALYQSLFSAP